MAHIDAAYYSQTYKGKPLPAGDFPRLAERASEAASNMSPYVALNGPAGLEATELSALKTATCVMAEFLGLDEAGEFTSEKVGTFSRTPGQARAEALREAQRAARAFLDAVGLTYCGTRRRA